MCVQCVYIYYSVNVHRGVILSCRKLESHESRREYRKLYMRKGALTQTESRIKSVRA